MIYVAKTDIEGNFHAVQKTSATREVVEGLIRNNKDHWIILESDMAKRMVDFILKEKAKLERRYNLDDLVQQLDRMESEIYEFRRFVEEESKRLKEAEKAGAE